MERNERNRRKKVRVQEREERGRREYDMKVLSEGVFAKVDV